MKRLLPILLTAVMLLTACGGSNKAAYDSATQSSTTTSGSYAPSAPLTEMGWAADMKAEESVEMPSMNSYASDSAASAPMVNTKIIYRADLSLETKEFDAVSAELDRVVESLGGYYESRNLNQGGTYRSLNCVVRVPSQQFSTFLTTAGQLAHMTNCNEYKEDVSEAYYDNEARLTTQRTKLERLHELLEKAATMEDIISLETAISETELQIEYLTGALRKYDSLIGYSTITVYLYEVYRLSTDEVTPLTFTERLSSALSTGLNRGIDDVEDFIISLARNWLSLLIWAVVILAAVVLLRRRARRRRENGVRRFTLRRPKAAESVPTVDQIPEQKEE